MPKKGRTKDKLSVTIDEKLLKDFYQYCDDNEKTYSKVVQNMIQNFMEGVKK